ncbi:MAG: hypothetical protein Fur005_46410 [Roseiflexaceae bacterium]
MTTNRPTPKFTGVDTYRDPKGRFQFRFPMNWHRYDLADKREGVLFSPESSNPQNWFSVWITDLKEKIVAEDMPVLRKGVEQGLSQLSNVQVEYATDDTLQNLVKFERIFTFDQNGTTRKWRQWQLYVDRWLMVVTFQGETPAEYDYWFPIANHSFLNFVLPEALWYAVDRDLAGVNRPGTPSAASSDDTDDGEE